MNKVDCVGEECANCRKMSCLRVAFLTKDGELAAYTDLCYCCAADVAREARIDGVDRDDFKVYHDRVYGTKAGG